MSISKDLNSKDKQRRLSGISRVWFEKDPHHRDEVKQLLCSDPDPEIRARSAWVLDNFCDFSTKNVLLDALNDGDRNVRSNAGWALVHLGKDVREDVERVLRQTTSEDTREMAHLILLRI